MIHRLTIAALLLLGATASAAPQVYRGTIKLNGVDLPFEIRLDGDSLPTPTPVPTPEPPPPPPPPPEPTPIPEATWHVTADSDGGDGSISNPWTLAQSCSSALIQPGDTVHVAPGDYKGRFNITISGQPSKPIKYLCYGARLNQGQTPIMGANPAGVQLVGNYLELHGLEVYGDHPQRTGFLAGSWAQSYRVVGLQDAGRGNGIYHCHSHDNGEGLDTFHGSVGGTYIGNLCFFNGWVGADRSHGHGFYIQGKDRANPKRLIACVAACNFSNGFQVYTEGATLDGIEITGCTTFATSTPASDRQGKNLLVTGSSNGVTISRLRSWFYPSKPAGYLWLGGLQVAGPNNVTVEDSAFGNGTYGFEVYGGQNVTFQRNRFSTGPQSVYPVSVWSEAPSQMKLGGNQFYNARRLSFGIGNAMNASGQKAVQAVDFAAFQQRYTSAASDTNITTKPAEQWIYSEKSPVRDDWRLVTIYNWTGAATATLSTADLPAGGYQVVNIQNITKPVATFTAPAGSVEIPLTPGDVTQPIGNGSLKILPTLPEFGVFIVQQTKYAPR